MSANFTPEFKGYSGQGTFRFWCQSVLPLVYDDSLSYMELLNKVVVYLNKTISDVAAVEENVDALLNSYNQLQQYVNDYFNNLDVQDEINNKLDGLVEDGTMDELLEPFVTAQIPGLVETGLPGVVEEQIPGVVAEQIDEVVATQLPTVAGESIPGVVQEWLNDNVDPIGSAVTVDKTLSITGSAADSKTVGDKFRELGDPVLVFTDGYLDSVSAALVSDNTYHFCSNVLIPAGVQATIITTADSVASAVAIKDEYNVLQPAVVGQGNRVHEYVLEANEEDRYIAVSGLKAYEISIIYPNPMIENIVTEVSSLKNTVKENTNGKSTLFVFANFENGSLSGGAVTKGLNLYRVATDTKITFDYDIVLKAKTGYRFLLNIFSGSSYVTTGWATEYSVAKNTEFKICIAKVEEDSSIIANVEEFVDSITFEAYLLQRINSIDGRTSDVENVIGETFTESAVTKSYANAAVYNGYVGPEGEFVNSDSFKTYVVQVEQQREIWFTDYATSNPYTSVAIYNEQPISSSALVGTRLRYNNDENTIPTNQNKLTVAANNYIAVTVRETADFKLWGTMLIIGLSPDVDISANIIANEDLIKNMTEKPKNYLRYYSTPSAGEKYASVLRVYLYNGNGYTLYLFTHSVDENNDCDVWRVHNAYMTDLDMQNMSLVTTNGEWECAIRIDGAQDFIGGLAHGDEVVESITFFVDGKAVDITSFTSLTEFEKLEIYEKSELTNPGTSDSDPDKGELVAKHNSIHVFEENELTINQTVEWESSKVLSNSYLAMLPALKSVTSKLLLNTDAKPITLGTYPLDKNKVRMANIYGDNVRFIFDIERYPLNQNNGADFRVHDNNGNNYNKCYYYITKAGDNVTANAGDIWVSECKYIIK